MSGNSSRPLDEREVALLNLLLSVDFPGVDRLRDQVPACRVAGPWSVGSASVDLVVADAAAAAESVNDGPAPITACVYQPAGELIGELLVWIGAGRLTAIECAWFTDDAPALPPDATQVVARQDRRHHPH
jgi:hypothetical protein